MIKVIELDIDAALSGDTGVFEVALVEYPAIEQELIYFGRQKFYKATQEVSDVACRAIRENEERGNPAATQVGKVRAQQLCSRSEISLETVKRMKSYLERAKVYNTDNFDDNGTISWHLWGGQPALDWVDNILSSLEKKEENMEIEPNPCWEGYEPYGTKILNGREVPNCIPVEAKAQFVKPSAGEEKSDFISRCIPVLKSEGKPDDQAAAICYSMWDQKFSVGRVGFDWEVLKTKNGLRYFEQELSRGVLPVIFVKGIPPKELYDFTLKYRIPITAINQYQMPNQKIDLIEKMGLVRHYDNDLNVRRELGPVGIIFDYDTSNIQGYVDYPDSGDTKSELTKAIAPPVLFEDCGCSEQEFAPYPWDDCISDQLSRGYSQEVAEKICGKIKAMNQSQEFNLLGYIDGMPIFETKEQAESAAEGMGCTGHHTHDLEGKEVYMPCEVHPDKMGQQVDVKGTEYIIDNKAGVVDIEVKDLVAFLKELKKTSKENFEAVTQVLFQGLTIEEVRQANFRDGQKLFRYANGNPAVGDSRDFCKSIENKYYRRSIIDMMDQLNFEFGHGQGGGAYSKWLYKGGPNCVHYWEENILKRTRDAAGNLIQELLPVGPVAGKPGTAPRDMANNGYYDAKTKARSERAYAISQNYSQAVFDPFPGVLVDDLQPLTYVEGLPIYGDEMSAMDASFAIGCGGIYEQYEYDGKKMFRSCSSKSMTKQANKQLFAAIEEQRMLYTPLMIPNILIPRMDDITGEKYWVTFKPETIEKIQRKFMIEQRLRETNLEHSDTKWQDVVMVESWIVQGDKDKAYELGFTKDQIPFGTWMAGYTVLDTEQGNEIWNNYIKPGKVRGASVEGNFILNFSAFKKDEYLLKEIINILKNI